MADPMVLAADGIAPTQFEIPGSRGDFRIQFLNEDAGRGVVTSIVYIPAGGFIPAHSHQAGAEMHYVLSGDLIERGERLGPGAFLTQAAGVVHADETGWDVRGKLGWLWVALTAEAELFRNTPHSAHHSRL